MQERRILQIKKRKSKQFFETLDIQPKSEIRKSAVSYFKRLNPVTLKLFNILVSYSMTCKQIWISQSALAERIGISRQYCNKLLQYLESEGLILSNYRHMKTCLYKISSFFRSHRVRHQLSFLIDAFKALSVALLTQYYSLHGIGIKRNIIISPVPQVSSGKETTRSMHSLLEQNMLISKISLNQDHENPISKSIRNLKGIPLTKWGQIKLSAFADDVIDEVAYQFNSTSGIRNQFNWFFSGCLRYSKQHGLSPNWSWSKKLALVYEMPKGAPMLVTKKSNPSFNSTSSSSLPNTKSVALRAVNSHKMWEPVQTQPIDIKSEAEKFIKYCDSQAYQQMEAIIGKEAMKAYLSRIFDVLVIKECTAH